MRHLGDFLFDKDGYVAVDEDRHKLEADWAKHTVSLILFIIRFQDN